MSDEDDDRRRRSPDSRGYGDDDGDRTGERGEDRPDPNRGEGNHQPASSNNNNNNGKGGGDDPVIGSTSLRPVFLGNLDLGYRSEEVLSIFEKPIEPPNASMTYRPIPVDRIDLKRGYCFVFLKDVKTQSEKDQAERFVQEINGMKVNYVSPSLRVEFARGDGRVKRKEDERRRLIEPCDTLFVVNFHEQTTRRADLEMLFEPYGEITRIDMKRNYAFIQFRTVEQATRAKDGTHGGKLDQSVLTVEFVARQHRPGSSDGRGGGGGGGGGGWRGGDRDRMGDGGRRGGYPPPPSSGGYDNRRRDYDRRSPPRGPPPPYGDPPQGRYYNDDRPRSRSRERGGGGGRPYDDPYYDRGRGDYDRGAGGGGPPRGGRSRSPPPSRPPPGGRYDDRDRDYRGGGGGGGGGDAWDRDRRASSRSPPRYRDSRPNY